MMLTRLVCFFSVLICTLNSFAQKPSISSVSRLSAGMEEEVLIHGSGFGSNPANLTVFFGGTAASLVSASDALLQVKVPAGASYDNISVTNTATGLSGYSPAQFLLSFSGEHGINAGDFAPEISFDAESRLYDICHCDFNGDGLNDIAVANSGANFMSVFTNTSSATTVSFTKVNYLINAQSLHVTCGDLNGDGRPDIVATENEGSRLYFLRNTGAGFSVTNMTLTGAKVKQIVLADLDQDGKADIIVGDQASPRVLILKNQSSLGSLSFSSTPFPLSIPGAQSSDAVDAIETKDLDGDGLPEVLMSKFNTATDIFVFRNQSTPASFVFTTPLVLAVNEILANLKVADLDGDLRPDIIATKLLTAEIAILRNTSTGSSLSFAPTASLAAASRPWGVDAGDLDGDGLPDLVLSSIDPASKRITILNNNSTPGTIAFEPKTDIDVTYINRHPQIADINGDGKPDVLYASVDDNNLGIPASKVSVLRNTSCFVPLLSPSSPPEICSGNHVDLQSPSGGGANLVWRRDGAVVPGESGNTLRVTTSGSYTLTATSEGGACEKSSAPVTVTVSTPAGALSGDTNARSNGPVCSGSTLTLELDDVGADLYRWTGPGGFTADGIAVNRTIADASESGIYVVEMLLGTCVAATDTVFVEIIDVPEFTVTHIGNGIFCEGSTQSITVSPQPAAGFGISWYKSGTGLIPDETNASLSVNASGSYYAVITPIGGGGCQPTQTDAVTLNAVPVPLAEFTASVQTACVGQVVSFTNTSTFDQNQEPVFLWDFGDGNTSSDENPTHTYLSAGSFDAVLTVAYQDDLCPNQTAQEIEVIAAPAVAISTSDGTTSICEGESLNLSVEGNDFTGWQWSTGHTVSTITVTEPGDYLVTVATTTGCTIEATITITRTPAPTVTVSASPTQINAGESSQLTASGLIDYLWQPGKTLSDSLIANPVASPLVTTVYTVTGIGANGCAGGTSLELIVTGGTALAQLQPKIYFSPNNDDLNNFWVVPSIENFPGCSVVIYNDKGSRVFEAKPYLNNWDGTFKGGQLPEGVYYYAIRCDGESGVKTGSITLLR